MFQDAQLSQPLFTNDLIGTAKALAFIFGPIFAGVLLYLKIGSREKIAEVKRAAEKADEDLKAEIANVKRDAERGDVLLKGDLNGVGTRVDGVVNEMARMRSDVDNVKSTIVESHRDTMAAIMASSEAQLKAVHAADLAQSNRIGDLRVDVGKLQATGDVAGRLASSIESLAEAILNGGGGRKS